MQLAFSYSFYDKTTIVREEKETTAATGALTSLEHLILIKNWMKRLLVDIWRKVGALLDLFKQLPIMHFNLDFSFYNLKAFYSLWVLKLTRRLHISAGLSQYRVLSTPQTSMLILGLVLTKLIHKIYFVSLFDLLSDKTF